MRKNNTKRLSNLFVLLLGILATVMLAFSVGTAKFVSADGIHFVVEKNTISSVQIVCNEELTIMPGQTKALTVSIFPEVANETLVKVEYQVVRGSAFILDSAVVASESAPIGEEIEVVALVDDIVSENSLVFTVVRIPTSSVVINNTEDTIAQGEVLQLSTEVLPKNATDKRLSFEIVSGKDYAQVNVAGKITIIGNLSAGDLEITVRATSSSDPSVFVEKVFKLYKPVEAIVSANADLTSVEQMRSYSFKANAEPYNATFGDNPVKYSLNVSSKIATIDEDGLLTVADDAPVGSEITIRIDATDGVFVEQTVTVVPVYATKFAIANYTAPSYNGKYMPNDRIEFSASFLEPFNITQANKTFGIRVSDTSLAKVYGNFVVINPLAEITVKNPHFTVTVYTVQNGIELSEEREIEIFVPATHIVANSDTSTLYENKTYCISDLIGYTIYPLNTDVLSGTYVLNETDFATLNGDKLAVLDNLPAGKVSISLYVTAYGLNSNTIEFDIYKPTRTLKLVADNTNPISKINSGEEVKLSTLVSETASVNCPRITIVSGAENIEGNYFNGDVIGDTFRVKPNLTSKADLNKRIALQAEQDGVTYVCEVLVYIPNETLSITSDSLNRGVLNSFTLSHSAHADDIRWEVVVADNCVEYVDVNSNIISVKQNTPAGTSVSVTYRSLDRVGTMWTHTFVVASLSDVQYEAVYSNSGAICDDKLFNVIIDKDSENIAIVDGYSQLHTGRYADVKVKYLGLDLMDFGLKLGDAYAIGEASAVKQNYDIVRVTIDDNADGKSTVGFVLAIEDGTMTYVFTCENIFNVFNPLKEENVKFVSNACYLYNNELKFDAERLSKTTYGIPNFAYQTVDPNMVEVSAIGGGIMATIKSITATDDKYAQVNVKCTQNYNFESIEFNTVLSLNIRKLKVNLVGDSGHACIVFADGLSGNCGTYTRTGYIFNGLFASDGVKIYESNGNLSGDYSKYNAYSEVSASWTAITYNVYFYWKVDCENGWNVVEFDDKTKGDKAITATYDVEQTVKSYPIKGVVFKHWTIDGMDGIFSYDKCPKYINLASTQGAVVKFRGHTDYAPTCVSTGTMITLADGSQKTVETLNATDKLLVWNFYTGAFDTAPVSFLISHGEDVYDVLKLDFGDTSVNVIGEHGFWDFDLNKYVYLSVENVKDYVGHRFAKEVVDLDGVRRITEVKLLGFSTEKEYTNTFSPMSDSHLCIFTNGMLSVSAETQGLVNYFDVVDGTLKYDEEKMQNDILKFGLFDFKKYLEGKVSKEIFDSVNGEYLSIAIGKGLITIEKMNSLIELYAENFVIGGAE